MKLTSTKTSTKKRKKFKPARISWDKLYIVHWNRQVGQVIACSYWMYLTHWGRVRHICVSRLTIIGSNNGLSPDRRQAFIWTNAGILLIVPLRTNFSEILIEIYTFSFRKMHLKMSSGKWRPFCRGLKVLKLSLWHKPFSHWKCSFHFDGLMHWSYFLALTHRFERK